MYIWPGLDARPAMIAEERSSYERQRAAMRGRLLAQTTATIGLFYLSYVAADILLLGDVTWFSLKLRFGVVLPMLLLLLAFQRGSASFAVREYATLAVAVVADLVWCVIVTHSENPAARHYFYAAVIFQMVITIGIRPSFALGVAGSLACFLVNYAFIHRVAGVDGTYVLYHLAVYLPTVALTLIALHQLEAEQMRSFLQLYENERLKVELSRQNGELEALAATDPLTQLPNRRGTALELERLRQVLRPQEIQLCTLLLIDIDHFKAFNDGYGHGAGDECLVRVARAMRRELPAQAYLSRHGGEEFLALIPDCDRDVAIHHAECLRRTVRAENIRHDCRKDRLGHVTVSIGVACGPLAGDAEFEQLLEAADRALYRVKGDGRDGWRLADAEESRTAIGMA